MIRIALPNKGRLNEAARGLIQRAGLDFEDRGERALLTSLGGDFLALFVRAQDIPEFVADGAADMGITGRDLVEETDRPVETLLDLGFGRCRLVVAVRDDGDDGDGGGIDDLPDDARVATSFPRLAERFFLDLGKRVEIVPVSGATEIAPHLGLANVIVDLVSTGSTLKMNGLREVATILQSTALMVARPEALADPAKGDLIRELVSACESVIRAENKRYLMANVPRSALADVRRILPGISGPTIVNVLDGADCVAAHAVVERGDVNRLIASLKRVGAEGILVTRIERLMP